MVAVMLSVELVQWDRSLYGLAQEPEQWNKIYFVTTNESDLKIN